MKLVTEEDDNVIPSAGTLETSTDLQLDLPSVIEVLTKHLLQTKVQTKVAVLQWIYHLHTKLPKRVNFSVTNITIFDVIIVIRILVRASSSIQKSSNFLGPC